MSHAERHPGINRSVIAPERPKTAPRQPETTTDGGVGGGDLDPGKQNDPNFFRKHWKKLTVGGAALLLAASVGVGAAVNASADRPPAGVEVVDGEPVYPLPDNSEYDVFAKISNSNDLVIGDIDRLLGYFTGPDVTREALIKALSQANQAEAERVLEVMGNIDDSDNVEVTQILGKYGFETNEIPRDMMGRISEINDFTESELDVIAFELYPDIPYDDIRDALAQFTQEETSTARDIVNGIGHPRVLNEFLESHGVDLPSGYDDN